MKAPATTARAEAEVCKTPASLRARLVTLLNAVLLNEFDDAIWAKADDDGAATADARVSDCKNVAVNKQLASVAELDV